MIAIQTNWFSLPNTFLLTIHWINEHQPQYSKLLTSVTSVTPFLHLLIFREVTMNMTEQILGHILMCVKNISGLVKRKSNYTAFCTIRNCKGLRHDPVYLQRKDPLKSCG